VAEPGLEEAFSDDLTVPEIDGYPLGTTLLLPHGASRRAARRLARGSVAATTVIASAARPSISARPLKHGLLRRYRSSQ